MTRYPKSGKGGKWTISELKSIPSDWKGDTLNDGLGLSGEVRVTADGVISIRFKYAYRWLGKVVWFSCGTYPSNDLAKIREARDFARQLVKSGIDPKEKKLADKINNQVAIEKVIAEAEQRKTDNLSFKDLYEVWIHDGVSRADKNKYLIQSFTKHALPSLAKISIKDLSEHHLRSLYRSIITAGKIATAVELSKDLGQMIRWAEKRKPWRGLLIDGNPAELVEIKKLVPADYSKERTRMLSIEEIKKLKSVFDTTASAYAVAPTKYGVERPIKLEVQIALWLCLSTVCRIGELLMTEWKHIDFEKRTWLIPAANTKGERGNKRSQIVCLSDFSLKQFKHLYTLTGGSIWAFPAQNNEGHVCIKSASKLIGDRQVKFKSRTRKFKCRVENNSLVLGEQEWTPHDLRRTGATMMQQLKVPRDVINLCQNHVIGSKVDRVYLLDDYADEKREAWQKLGDRLEAILKATNVLSLKIA